ncbi:hypothetical protein [Dactylosporangium sp. CA-092794]|uniref:hypothetical protein n=1 Tax=Dactylosporangium sp. CA-092794 TaxID=3239929 RepID=UPI003D8E91CB
MVHADQPEFVEAVSCAMPDKHPSGIRRRQPVITPPKTVGQVVPAARPNALSGRRPAITSHPVAVEHGVATGSLRDHAVPAADTNGFS